jgi:arylsulfatase A-like enzyme
MSTNQKDDLWDGDVLLHQTGYLTDLLGARAVDVVNAYAKATQPFFLSLHFNAPHWPWEGPGDEAESARVRSTDLNDYDGGNQKTYQRMIQAMDVQIGRVLQALDANRIGEDTIVVFTSDNGGERFADTWPFTGRKQELLEGGLRIPLLVSWPARIPPGQSDQVAMTMDWLPTLLAAAGTSPDPAFPPDGLNLLPTLIDRRPPVSRKLYWRYKANHQRAMRDGDFKYLKILDNTFLFNIVDDPMERANLKDRRKDIFDRLEKDWYEWDSTMLPEVDESRTGSNAGDRWADHIGSPRAVDTADKPLPPGRRD